MHVSSFFSFATSTAVLLTAIANAHCESAPPPPQPRFHHARLPAKVNGSVPSQAAQSLIHLSCSGLCSVQYICDLNEGIKHMINSTNHPRSSGYSLISGDAHQIF